MSGTKIIKCTCKNDFQDREYGKQQRLANVNEAETSSTCTVCGNKISQLTSKKK
jgi:hypothetical protein